MLAMQEQPESASLVSVLFADTQWRCNMAEDGNGDHLWTVSVELCLEGVNDSDVSVE